MDITRPGHEHPKSRREWMLDEFLQARKRREAKSRAPAMASHTELDTEALATALTEAVVTNRASVVKDDGEQ